MLVLLQQQFRLLICINLVFVILPRQEGVFFVQVGTALALLTLI